MILMFTTAIITLFIPVYVGPQFLNYFEYIHLLNFLTLCSPPAAIIAIKKGQMKKHKLKIIFLYIGTIIITGRFIFTLGSYLHSLFLGN